MRRRLLLAGLFLALLPTAPAAAAADELVADLSDHRVKVTMGFEGAELLLFGAVEGEGDVVVLVHGPLEELTVRRKDRVGPIWMNRGEMSFERTPAFYRVLSSRVLGDWLPDAVRERHQIGVDHLQLPPRGGQPASEVATFHRALIRRKLAAGHYGEEFGGKNGVKLLTQRLFRADVTFPTNVPVGIYTVEIFLIKDGTVVSAQTIPLPITKTGILAEIFAFAHDYAAIYGILAIIFAILAGLGANAAFRKL